MREYQANSHKSKAEKSSTEAAPVEKKVSKVVSGKVKTKSNEKRKLFNMFISEDAANVKSYILMDVLVPAVKKALLDIITDGADMILYGGSGGGRKHKSGNKVSYRSYYDDRKSDRFDKTERLGRFDYDDLVFESRAECETIRESMIDLIDQYGFVTVADMYDMADVNAPHTFNKYGWTNIRNAETVRVRDGYKLKLPKAMPID